MNSIKELVDEVKKLDLKEPGLVILKMRKGLLPYGSVLTALSSLKEAVPDNVKVVALPYETDLAYMPISQLRQIGLTFMEDQKDG